MKAEELRIGNLVNYRIVDNLDQRKEWFDVSVIDYDDLRILYNKDNLNQDYQPIPLTEEWLLKFWFQDRFLLCDNHKIDYEITEQSEIIFWLNENGVNLEFVHQLQNLYFSLTGEELTIK